MLVLAAMAAAAAGCLVKETTHTLYLSPDGAVTWSVVEKDVRSDCTTEQERTTEEQEFLALALSGGHSTAEAFRELGGTGVTSTAIRHQRPFTVITQAGFPGIDGLFQQLLNLEGIAGRSELKREGERVEWTLALWPDQERAGPGGDDLAAVLSPFWDADGWRIVLEDGRFVGAEGFDLSDDGVVATLREDGPEGGEDPRETRIQLTWSTRRARN
jgi:hypothetical protein